MFRCLVKMIQVLSMMLFFTQLQAACTVTTASQQTVGIYASDQMSGFNQNITFSSNFECDPALLNLLSGDRIDATLVAADFSLTDSGGMESIPYTIFTDTARTDPFLVGETLQYGTFTLVDLLGLFSNPDGSLALYLQTGLANVPVGSYSDTLTIFWDWDYCESISALSVCLSRDTGSATATITLTLDVTSSCAVNSSNISLGSHLSLATEITAIMPIDVLCTKQHSYQLYVDQGDNYTSSYRNMINDSYKIPYRILGLDGIADIGPSVSNSESLVGTGLTQNPSLTVKTVVSDTFPPAGVYQDTVRVIVEY